LEQLVDIMYILGMLMQAEKVFSFGKQNVKNRRHIVHVHFFEYLQSDCIMYMVAGITENLTGIGVLLLTQYLVSFPTDIGDFL